MKCFSPILVVAALSAGSLLHAETIPSIDPRVLESDREFLAKGASETTVSTVESAPAPVAERTGAVASKKEVKIARVEPKLQAKAKTATVAVTSTVAAPRVVRRAPAIPADPVADEAMTADEEPTYVIYDRREDDGYAPVQDSRPHGIHLRRFFHRVFVRD